MSGDDLQSADDRTRPARNEPALGTVVGLLGLAGLLYGAAQATDPGLAEGHRTGLVLTAATGLGWCGWLVGPYGHRRLVSLSAVAVLAVTGGAMAASSTFGAVVVGVAALCAATLLELLPAAALAVGAVAAAAVAVTAAGQAAGRLPGVGIGALLGLILGVARRQQRVGMRADAELAVARERGFVEHERAELLAERNRIAREVHDVLAHTLSALSIQMTALDSLVEGGAGVREVQAAVGRSRRLVVEGLGEARRAVRALRDEPVALDEQLAALADGEGGIFRLGGCVRDLPAAAGRALLRVAQEALTNARKHAPGATVTVELAYDPSRVTLRVTNPAPAGFRTESARELTGGGYGLHGMRERVELLGGTLSAGPSEGGWRVEAEVPV